MPMKDDDLVPLPVLGKDGVWRDPMPLEAMTPKQRARYVRMLREDADCMGPRGDLRYAREQVERIAEQASGPRDEDGEPDVSK
jgi:hypothetical protein